MQVAPGTELKSWEARSLLPPLYANVIHNLNRPESNVTGTLQLGPVSIYEAKYGPKDVMRAKYLFLLRSMIALYK